VKKREGKRFWKLKYTSSWEWEGFGVLAEVSRASELAKALLSKVREKDAKPFRFIWRRSLFSVSHYQCFVKMTRTNAVKVNTVQIAILSNSVLTRSMVWRSMVWHSNADRFEICQFHSFRKPWLSKTSLSVFTQSFKRQQFPVFLHTRIKTPVSISTTPITTCTFHRPYPTVLRHLETNSDFVI
jgi:hypothetical protein